MTIKVGDNVIWRSGKHKNKSIMPLGIAGRVIALGISTDNKPAAMLDLGDTFGKVNAYVADLEPIKVEERKKPKLTVISGG